MTRARSGASRPARSTPARSPTRPRAPGPCRSTRRRATRSATAKHAANLFALAEMGNIYTRIMNPTQAVVRGPHRRPRGRARTRSASPAPSPAARAGRRDAGDPQPGRGGDHIVSSPIAVRRHLQPLPLHAAQARHRGQVRRRPRRPRRSGGPPSGPTPSVFFGETLAQPQERRLRHRGRRRAWPTSAGIPLMRRQHRADAVPHAGRSSGAPTSSCTRPPSSSAATAPRSAA